MARLLGEKIATAEPDRQAQVIKLAQLTHATCLLKGMPTLLTSILGSDCQVMANTTGSVALAKGGSGDVLSGVIAGLWAQMGMAEGFSFYTAWKAAVSAVYLHGLAGQLAAKQKSTYGVLARDIMGALPQAILQVQEGE